MTQLALGEEERPALGDTQAEHLGLVLLGFVAPGRWDSGAKVPDKVRQHAAQVAQRAARDLASRLP